LKAAPGKLGKLQKWPQARTAAHRCPATREIRGPKTTALPAARMGNGLVDATAMPTFKEDVVAFRIFGVGVALQDEHCFQFDERLR